MSRASLGDTPMVGHRGAGHQRRRRRRSSAPASRVAVRAPARRCSCAPRTPSSGSRQACRGAGDTRDRVAAAALILRQQRAGRARHRRRRRGAAPQPACSAQQRRSSQATASAQLRSAASRREPPRKCRRGIMRCVARTPCPGDQAGPAMKQALSTLAAVAALAARRRGARSLWSGWLRRLARPRSTCSRSTRCSNGVMHRSVQAATRAASCAPACDAAARGSARGAALLSATTACNATAGRGVAQCRSARSMQPLPGPLVDAPRALAAARAVLDHPPRHQDERHAGLGSSGCPTTTCGPSSPSSMRLPALGTPADYRRWIARLAPDAVPRQARRRRPPPAPDARARPRALPPVRVQRLPRDPGRHRARRVHVGPPLGGLAGRALIAGKLANTPDNLVRWLREPPRSTRTRRCPTWRCRCATPATWRPISARCTEVCS